MLKVINHVKCKSYTNENKNSLLLTIHYDLVNGSNITYIYINIYYSLIYNDLKKLVYILYITI